MERIGLFGGSFDPIHSGHLLLAEQAREQGNLSRVILMPARVSPFKTGAKGTDADHRLAMTRLAAEGNPFFTVSDWEIKREAVSYSIHTLDHLQQEYPQAEICFILGTDAFLTLDRWYQAERILSEYTILVGTRGGYKTEELDRCLQRYLQNGAKCIEKITMPQVELSSSEVRKALKEGRSVRYQVPEAVAAYLREQGLYLGLSELQQKAMEQLTEKRRRHTAGVLREGLLLCRLHGQDAEAFRTAACFHDLYRGIAPEELHTIAEKEGLEEKYWDSPNLAHGKLAAIAMEREYGITDSDILNAVCYHTTGRPAMSKLEKILYIADASEEGRSYPGVETLRQLAREDLNKACLWSMNSTIAFVEARGQELDTDTLQARDYLLAEEQGAE